VRTVRPVQLRNETELSITCAASGCNLTIPPAGTGRPPRFCSTTCRVRDHRHRHATDTISVEVDMGSATSRGRLPERAWLVRIRRGHRLRHRQHRPTPTRRELPRPTINDLLTKKSPEIP
jgi:hypothetical protein